MPRSRSAVPALLVAAALTGAVVVTGGAATPAGEAEEAPPASGAGFTLADWPASPAAERGAAVYTGHCIGCHGPEGEADGPAARWLDPIPRNFQKANFKFRSTPSGELPTEDDLLHVVTCGLKGSSMPGFPLMPERQRRDVVAWVLHLATFGLVRGEVESLMEDGMTWEEIQAEEWDELVEEVMFDAFEEVWPVAVPLAPEMDSDSVERGRELYQAQCVACHGASGRGDGPSSFTLRDWKDSVVRPRDFTTGVFRAGSEPRDVFVRMKTGLNGTPMPEIYGSDDDLWAIVHYILSLQDETSRVAPHPTSCEAHDAIDR